MLTVRNLSYSDVESIILLQEKVKDSLNDKTMFYPATIDELKHIIKYTGYAVGLYCNEQIIGYATIIFCYLDNKLKDTFDIDAEFIHTTAVFDDVAILPQYRGKKYQLLLWNYLANQFCLRQKYLITSIHPQNTASLRNAYHFGMEIYKQKKMYSNSLRCILLKKL